MKGTEKQIAWATDIINKPAEIIRAYAKFLETANRAFDCYRPCVPSILRGVEMYLDAVNKLPQFDNARTVIDYRCHFSPEAKRAVEICLTKDGFDRRLISDIMANLSLRGV